MSVVINNEIKLKIKEDFKQEISRLPAEAARIKKHLASKYGISIKTIRRITAAISPSTPSKPAKKSVFKNQTIIFTAWDVRVKIDKNFVSLLNSIADYYDAKIYLKCLNNNDRLYFAAAMEKIASITSPKFARWYIADKDETFNSNIQFKDVDVSPTVLSPIAGWENVFEKSTIIGGLVKDLKTEKTYHLCKQIMSTGSIGKLEATYEDYKLLPADKRKEFDTRWKAATRYNKAFHIAKEVVEPCALIIDIVDNKTFFPRYITKKKANYIYDRNLKFIVGKNKPETIQPKGLVIGDFHSIETCPKNLTALEEIATVIKPKAAVLHDFVSFNSINRYEWDDFANVLKAPTLEEERIDANTKLSNLEKYFEKLYYIQSNHCNFLTKFLADEQKYKLNLHNYKKALELRLWSLHTGKHPVIKFLNLDKRSKVQFVSESHDLTIADIFIKHGHEGLSGAKAGFRAMAKAYSYKYIQAHLHTLEIFRGSAMCGTSSKLKLGYNKGPSNWINAHLLIFEDGSIQNITVIDGKWRKN